MKIEANRHLQSYTIFKFSVYHSKLYALIHKLRLYDQLSSKISETKLDTELHAQRQEGENKNNVH